MKVTLLVFTLNEIEGMKIIMPKINQDWVDEIIIVDGGSTDGTIKYVKECGYKLIVQKKEGIRCAYIEAMECVKTDFVITFSPDGNSIPEKIPELIEKMSEGYDMVIVSRYAKDVKSYDDDVITAFGNWMFTSLINLLYGARYTDAMVIFRGWKSEIFKALDLDREESYQTEERIFRTKIGVEPLLSVRAGKKKLKCCDIPGDEPPRIGGERKLKVLKWGAAYLMQVLKEKFYWH
ncbi:MAG: glycosyltransferase family 2 protein [Candidatus Saelkia tenebricola]|nr:glycosyltransferase family 2 protein [Candidatus Saelkia tenebricola]